MKKIVLLLAALPFMAAAQSSDYNKWSIEIGGGATNPFRAVTPGYQIDELFNAKLGVRYMMNTKFGFMADAGYHNLESEDGTPEFETNYYRGSFQGVLNVGNMVDIKNTFLKNFGVLVHAGAGLSNLDFRDGLNDWSINGIVGVTPQVKLGERVTLNADLSLISNVMQETNFDGAAGAPSTFLDGSILTANIGLSINLGKAASHADWTYETPWEDDIQAVNDRVAKIETDLIDTDQDGVPDYLDREPNTASGASVNTKGITKDLNQNGIPDEFETSLDRKYASKEEVSAVQSNYSDAIKELLNGGYVNVYFDTNKSTPATYSLNAINYLITYMNDNPSAQAELVGYADKRGSEAYNANLSERRAQKVMDILVGSGIDASRLSMNASGEQESADASAALQLQRKVTFKLK